MRKILLLMLLAILGGASSVKAEKMKLYSSAITKVNTDCDYDTENHLFTWNGTGNNTARILQFDAGLLAHFTKLHITCDVKTAGGNFRILIGNDSFWKQFYYDAQTTNIEITFSSVLSEDEILRSTEIRIAGNSSVTQAQEEASIDKHKMEILPSNIYLESDRELPFAIASTSDWNEFSLLVKNGLPSLNATLTADIEVSDGTMIGNGSSNRDAANPNAYSGTFDGQNHTITYSSFSKTTEPVTAPFRFVKGGTIQNLRTAGSMSSTRNIMGGIAGYVQGTVVINNCYSSMNLSTDDTANDATIGGILGLQDQSPTALTVTNCMYTGTLTGDHGISGIAGYMRNGGGATFTSVLYAGSYSTENASPGNMNNIVRGGGTLTNCYYVNKIAGKTDGTEATSAKLASGEVTYTLQNSQATQYWGQNLKAGPSDPMLTSNTAYKVYSLGGGEYANMINSIGSTEDWVLFSKLVAAGETDMDVTMTADVNAGSTMVGNESNKYAGTFDGAGHTLTFNYEGLSSMVAPFKEVNGATIIDLKTTGSITSSDNLLAGIVGQVNGATTLTRCASDMSITTTVGDNGRIGGLVARNAQEGSSLTLNNCMYNGAINSSTNNAAGFVGWSPNATTISNCLVAASSITGGEANFAPNYITIPDGKYALYISKFGSSTQGTAVTDAQRYNGYVAYTLSSDISEGTLFFGQGYLNSSRVEDCPSLTSVASKKVLRTYKGETNFYSNPGGLLPDPALCGMLSWKFTMSGEAPYQTHLPADQTTDRELCGTPDAYNLVIGIAGAATFVFPFTTDELPSGVKAYDLTFDGSVINATEVNKITADKPVLINAEAGTYKFESKLNWWETVDYSTHTATTNGALTGVYNTSLPFSYVPEGAYVLQNGPEGLCFYQVDAENTIKITSFRAYLTADAGDARALSIKYPDDETAINQVQASGLKVQDSEIFNLAGQRMSKLQKGVNIVNGKKIMVK